jgi:hypothetical protein
MSSAGNCEQIDLVRDGVRWVKTSLIAHSQVPTGKSLMNVRNLFFNLFNH